MNFIYKYIVFLGMFFVSQQVFTQTFTKITDGNIYNDGGQSEGVCWGDYDNDGWVDLYVTNGLNRNEVNFLYHNNGDGTFTRILSGEIVTDEDNSRSASWGDFNNDGYLDMICFNLTGPRQLYLNNTDGTFTKITGVAAVIDSGVTVGGTWVDYDNDGYLDVWAADLQGPDYLYRNNQDLTFTRITTGSMVSDMSRNFDGAWGDFDDDGDQDLFVANGFLQFLNNALYINNGDGTFTDDFSRPFVNVPGDDASATWVDYDNDRDLDLFVTTGPNGTNDLYRNEGPAANYAFTQITSGAIVTDSLVFSSSQWGDFDNDGDLDVYNASVGRQGSPGHVNSMFLNNGDGTFTKVTDGEIVNEINNSFSCALADYDNDGDLDIFVAINGSSGPDNNLLFRNDTDNQNNWIKIRCMGDMAFSPSAFGAKVYLNATIAGESVWQTRVIAGQTGLFGQNDLTVHFGLGDATVVDSLVIHWPTGFVETLTDVAVNEFYRAVEGMGLNPITALPAAEERVIPQQITLAQNYPNPFNPTTTITYTLPQTADVRLTVYNTLGQTVRTLVQEQQAAGEWSAVWDGRSDAGQVVSSGVYIYRLHAGANLLSRKMLLLK